MEIELKYRIDSEEVAEAIFSDSKILAITDANSDESIALKATYFDTDDRRLSRELMTFRVRREGKHLVATLKWNGQSEDGMHVREEINVPVMDESKLETPDIHIFAQTPMYEELQRIIGRRELHGVIEVEVIRRQIRLDTGKSISELSYDKGWVMAEDKKGVISEMELELYSGEKEDMEELGADIAERFNLVTENRSKFRQGMDLLKNNEEKDR